MLSFFDLCKDEKKEQRNKLMKERKDKKQYFINEHIKYNEDKIQQINNEIKELENKLSLISNTNLPYYKHLQNKIKLCETKKLSYDLTFIKRNNIKTQMCPRSLKGKECKFEECLFAHKEEDIRIPKCVYHISNCCTKGLLCGYDHSDSPLPEIPVKKQEEIVVCEEHIIDIINIDETDIDEEISSIISEDLNLNVSFRQVITPCNESPLLPNMFQFNLNTNESNMSYTNNHIPTISQTVSPLMPSEQNVVNLENSIVSQELMYIESFGDNIEIKELSEGEYKYCMIYRNMITLYYNDYSETQTIINRLRQFS